MSGHQASVPKVAAEYFGPTDYRTHPVIAQTFRPSIGWRTYNSTKRISLNHARKLRAAGVTSVALRSNGRLADFQIKELVR